MQNRLSAQALTKKSGVLIPPGSNDIVEHLCLSGYNELP